MRIEGAWGESQRGCSDNVKGSRPGHPRWTASVSEGDLRRHAHSPLLVANPEGGVKERGLDLAFAYAGLGAPQQTGPAAKRDGDLCIVVFVAGDGVGAINGGCKRGGHTRAHLVARDRQKRRARPENITAGGVGVVGRGVQEDVGCCLDIQVLPLVVALHDVDAFRAVS